MRVLAVLLGAVLVIACAIALAPYIWPLLGLTLVAAILVGALILVAAIVSPPSARVVAWYDRTRFADWVASGFGAEARRRRHWERAARREARREAEATITDAIRAAPPQPQPPRP